MNTDILEEAIVRLDRAVTRAEAAHATAAARPAPAAPPPAGTDPGLAERHERLRAGTRAALDRLDAILPADDA